MQTFLKPDNVYLFEMRKIESWHWIFFNSQNRTNIENLVLLRFKTFWTDIISNLFLNKFKWRRKCKASCIVILWYIKDFVKFNNYSIKISIKIIKVYAQILVKLIVILIIIVAYNFFQHVFILFVLILYFILWNKSILRR